VLKDLQKDANVVNVACGIEAILRIWPETWDYMAIYFPVSRKYLIKHWKCAFEICAANVSHCVQNIQYAISYEHDDARRREIL
jgi:hypothetical protein